MAGGGGGTGPPPASGPLGQPPSHQTPATRSASARPHWLIPAIVGGVALAAIGAVFLFQGNSPSTTQTGANSPAPIPPPPTPLHPTPKTPGKDEPPAVPAPDKPVAPVPETTDDEPAADEAHLLADERVEIADAKKAILQLISNGSRISAEDLETQDTSLPEVKNTDLPGAKAAVERSLELWKADKGVEVAARIPDALLASIGKSISTPANSVRMMLETTVYVPVPLTSISTGKAVAMGSEWALVKYDTIRAGGASASAVAVCVREGGVWKVFL